MRWVPRGVSLRPKPGGGWRHSATGMGPLTLLPRPVLANTWCCQSSDPVWRFRVYISDVLVGCLAVLRGVWGSLPFLSLGGAPFHALIWAPNQLSVLGFSFFQMNLLQFGHISVCGKNESFRNKFYVRNLKISSSGKLLAAGTLLMKNLEIAEY